MVRMKDGNMRPLPHTAGVGNEKEYDKGALKQKMSPNPSGIKESAVKKVTNVKTGGEGRAFEHKADKMTGVIGKEDGGGAAHIRKEHPIDYAHDRGPHQHKGGKYKV